MKRIIFGIFLIGLGLTSCDRANKSADAETEEYADKLPKIVFADEGVYDFGTITEGQVVERDFKFKNEGSFPLIISNINVSCGCTTPEWPKQPIEPGKESTIKVRFNSAGKRGEQNKTVTVYANTKPEYTELAFRALVKPKADSTQTASK
jgi:hypothetical protein